MTIGVLPDFLPQLNESASNLAGLSMVQAYPTPSPKLYRAWDGVPIGYSSDCDPLTAEPELSGLDGLLGGVMDGVDGALDAVDEYRIETGQSWALPLLLGALSAGMGRPLWQTAAWAAGAYLAPLPIAGFFAFRALSRPY